MAKMRWDGIKKHQRMEKFGKADYEGIPISEQNQRLSSDVNEQGARTKDEDDTRTSNHFKKSRHQAYAEGYCPICAEKFEGKRLLKRINQHILKVHDKKIQYIYGNPKKDKFSVCRFCTKVISNKKFKHHLKRKHQYTSDKGKNNHFRVKVVAPDFFIFRPLV